MRGKYSPTVSEAYAADQNWHDTYADGNWYDPDGYDSYGYDENDIDRAGNHENDYMSDEDLYMDVYSDWGFSDGKPST